MSVTRDLSAEQALRKCKDEGGFARRSRWGSRKCIGYGDPFHPTEFILYHDFMNPLMERVTVFDYSVVANDTEPWEHHTTVDTL